MPVRTVGEISSAGDDAAKAAKERAYKPSRKLKRGVNRQYPALEQYRAKARADRSVGDRIWSTLRRPSGKKLCFVETPGKSIST